MPLKLIVIYAAYGDALLLQTPDEKYWLIDGGPINPTPRSNLQNDRIPLSAYYQYLKRALYRYCSTNGVIDRLSGIIVTHPDSDHMDGVNRLLQHDIIIPANFKGPVILNEIFFRRDGDNFRYPLAQFLDANTLFGFSEVLDPLQVKDASPDHDNNIPPNMINASLTRTYKMVHGKNRNPYPEPTEAVWRWERHHRDSSEQNWSSIITLWREGVGDNAKLSLVTTGDGLPSEILNRMNMAGPPKSTTPAVGIFKVPHHGSENNNQWADDLDYVGDVEHESRFFFCVTMLAFQYIRLARNKPPTRISLYQVDRFKDGVLRGSPMLNWTRTYNASPAEFAASIQQLSEAFRTHITHLEEFEEIAKIDDQPFNLLDELQLREFAEAMIARYIDRKSQIIDHGWVTKSGVGTSKVTISFNRKTFKETFLKNLNAFKATNTESFDGLFDCLESNALGDLRKARLAQNFYSKFTAANYVISANKNPHGHPHPSVLAGLMAHLILTVPGTTDPCRIFVTDGAGIQVDYIYDLLQSLISRSAANPLPPNQWNQKVRVYCLATDFLAEIPVDHSAVEGVREIDFSAYQSQEDKDYHTFLHDQFLKAKPYDMPRAAISHTSKFSIIIWSEADQDGPPKFLDMDATGTLKLATLGTQPLFNLQYMDHNTTNRNGWTNKTEPHFVLFTDPARNNGIPNLVFLRKKTDPTLSDSHVYKDSTIQPLQTLHLVQGAIWFKPDLGGTQAIVRFQRNT